MATDIFTQTVHFFSVNSKYISLAYNINETYINLAMQKHFDIPPMKIWYLDLITVIIHKHVLNMGKGRET